MMSSGLKAWEAGVTHVTLSRKLQGGPSLQGLSSKPFSPCRPSERDRV